MELDIQSKLASVCGDLLYCDISALETVCSDILLKGDETTGNDVRNTRNKRSSQTNSQERVQKILIRFKMIGEFTYVHRKVGEISEGINAQCPRTDLSKRFLPKPMTTTG